jgi:alanine dehydrogenase
MIIGIPTEVKDNEYRVAATPEGVRELAAAGHEVVLQSGAGEGSAIGDEEYARAGARIAPDADEVFARADMILKVKEPQPEEYARFRPGQLLFTFLHLAADRALTEFLAERDVTSVAYETVQLPDRSLPLLAPMSEIAGRMAPSSWNVRAAGAGSSWAAPRASPPHEWWCSAPGWPAATPRGSPREWRRRSPSSI